MNNQFDYTNQFDSNSQAQNPKPQRQYVTYIPYGFTPETYEESKQVKKIANIIGGSLIIMSTAPLIVVAIQLVLSILGFWGVKEYELFSSPAFSQYLQAMLSILMFTLPFIFLFKVGGYRISSLIKFKKPNIKKSIPYFLLGAGVCFFASFSVNFASEIFKNIGINYEVDFGEIPGGFLGFMLTFIAIAVVPPLVEEFACRGLILGSLRKYGDSFAVVVSSIIFGIMHGNFKQIPFAFLVGMVLGFITIKTKTIWVAVAVHAFNNGVSVIIDYLSKIFEPQIVNLFSVVILSALMLLTVLSLLLLSNRDKAFKPLKKGKTKAESKQIYKWFFTAPTIVIFIILSVIKALLFFK